MPVRPRRITYPVTGKLQQKTMSRLAKPMTSYSFHGVETEFIFVWDLDETIIIFNSLLDGSFAHRFGTVSHLNYNCPFACMPVCLYVCMSVCLSVCQFNDSVIIHQRFACSNRNRKS